MRKNEFDVLARAIYAKESDKRYGNNRPAYTILLGDYNLNLPSSTAKAPYLIEAFEIEDGNTKKIITTVQHDLSTLRKQDSDNDAKGIFANNYDHFTYDIERFNGVIMSCNHIDTVEKYCGGDAEKHIKNISDHIPVSLGMEIRG